MKINLKYFNKKALTRRIIRLVCATTIVTAVSGLPSAEKHISSNQYCNNDAISYRTITNEWSFSKICTDETISYFANDQDELVNYPKNKYITLKDNAFITDLTLFKPIYDDIEELDIINCSAIVDLSPLCQMKKLKQVNIHQCPGVSRELVEYLNNHNILHNITAEDIQISERIHQILNSIIDDSMQEQEMIKAISLYILNEYSYNDQYTHESNINPISCFFKHKQGVCASYAYFTNIMLRLAGIEAYQVWNKDHTWNIVKIDGKYYHLDTTWADHHLNILCIDLFNSGSYYMCDPIWQDKIGMVKYDDNISNYDMIPKLMANDILKSEKEKNNLELNDQLIRAYIDRTIQLYLYVAFASKCCRFIIKKMLYEDENKANKKKLLISK